MDLTIGIPVGLTLLYCIFGAGVYRLCRSSSLGELDTVPPLTIFLWPMVVVFAIFAEG